MASSLAHGSAGEHRAQPGRLLDGVASADATLASVGAHVGQVPVDARREGVAGRDG